MDWNNRKYYCVSFHPSSKEMRVRILKLIDNVKVRPCSKISKQPGDKAEQSNYQFLVSAPITSSEAVEYELRKAERRDDWCIWQEMKRSI